MIQEWRAKGGRLLYRTLALNLRGTFVMRVEKEPMLPRAAIPKRLEKRLYQEVGSRCPICQESDVTKLTVHHITPYAQLRKHLEANMICLCRNCHAKADANEISIDDLFRLKRELRTRSAETHDGRRRDARISVKGTIAAGRDNVFHGPVVVQEGVRKKS